jgi:hypothetical protein
MQTLVKVYVERLLALTANYSAGSAAASSGSGYSSSASSYATARKPFTDHQEAVERIAEDRAMLIEFFNSEKMPALGLTLGTRTVYTEYATVACVVVAASLLCIGKLNACCGLLQGVAARATALHYVITAAASLQPQRRTPLPQCNSVCIVCAVSLL